MSTAADVRAKDLMNTNLITLRADGSLEEAVRTFEDYKISGAPVVDDAGNLVGVLSARDVAKTEHIEGDRFSTERAEYYMANPLEEDDEFEWERDSFNSPESFSPELQEKDSIRTWMSRDIVSVAEDASVKEVAKCMTEKGVHRVLVVDVDMLKGIISTMDVVRYVAQGT